MGRRNDISRILKACILLTSLVALLLVKSFHTHSSTDCPADTTSSVSLQHSCEICDFVLSPFVSAEVPILEVAASPCCLLTPILAEDCIAADAPSILLRGPPTA